MELVNIDTVHTAVRIPTKVRRYPFISGVKLYLSILTTENMEWNIPAGMPINVLTVIR